MSCYVVVALEAEARPLIERYGLRREAAPSEGAASAGAASKGPFRLYRGENLWLVLSGIGKIAAAAATGYLARAAYEEVRSGAGSSKAPPRWINLGIAGHATREIGEAVLAHSIRDEASGKCWQLPPPAAVDGQSAEVVTVDRPITGAAWDTFRGSSEGDAEGGEDGPVVDMEAAGFCATAWRLAPPERIHCLKIISDNAANPADRVTKAQANALIAQHLARLDGLLTLA